MGFDQEIYPVNECLAFGGPGLSRPLGFPVLLFSSGKGGVGKTSLVANLGTLLARRGNRVLLIDVDSGLANLDILLGIQPDVGVDAVMGGQVSLRDAIRSVEPNLWLLPGSCQWKKEWGTKPIDLRRKFFQLLEKLPYQMDFVLADCGAGIHDGVLAFQHPQFESVVILTPEPTSFADAYSLIKRVSQETGRREFRILVNQVQTLDQGDNVFKKLQSVVRQFLPVDLIYWGSIGQSASFSTAVIQRKIWLDLESSSSAKEDLERISSRMEFRIGKGHA